MSSLDAHEAPFADAPISLSRAALAPSRMTMSPPPSAVPVMPPPRAVAMRAKRATSVPTPGNGPLRMTMSMSIESIESIASIDRRWSS